MIKEDNTPNPIKEHYIAYMDILGYRAYFKEHGEDAPVFLKLIHDAINHTQEHIQTANMSPILSDMAEIHIKLKLFSDNILLCMETSESIIEPLRFLFFLQIIADIQRGFVTSYGLFLRGGISKGDISFNTDYVFGQGLIDVVEAEEHAVYPRIVIEETLAQSAQSIRLFSEEETAKAFSILEAFKNNQSLSADDSSFYSTKILPSIYAEIAANNLIWPWEDEKFFVNYLSIIDENAIFGTETVNLLKEAIKTVSPSDYARLNQTSPEQDKYMLLHKQKIEEKLRIYGGVHKQEQKSVNKDSPAKVDSLREHILKKYVWAMTYHNRVCKNNGKMDFFINSSCNINTRFLTLMINVLGDETDTNSE